MHRYVQGLICTGAHLVDKKIVNKDTIAAETNESPAALVKVIDQLNVPLADAGVLTNAQKYFVPSFFSLSIFVRFIIVGSIGRFAFGTLCRSRIAAQC